MKSCPREWPSSALLGNQWIRHSHGQNSHTQVFANVLNLNDRSIPCPFEVRDQLGLLLVRPSSALVKAPSSEPSEKVALVAIAAAVLEKDLEGVEGWCRRRLIGALIVLDDSVFIVACGLQLVHRKGCSVLLIDDSNDKQRELASIIYHVYLEYLQGVLLSQGKGMLRLYRSFPLSFTI